MFEQRSVYHDTIGSLLPVSDVLFLNCSSTTETSNALSTEQNALLPDGANIVNTTRGALIAERALADALTSGKLASAGLLMSTKRNREVAGISRHYPIHSC